MAFLQENFAALISKTSEHFLISMAALLLGVIVAVPMGVVITKKDKIANAVIAVASVLQTIPSLALLSIMVPIVGIGKKPAIIALFIYSLLPILRNTAIGMKSIDESLLDAAKGMGMTTNEVIFKVQLPLCAPVIMSGIRLSAIYVISWTAIASYIGAGGLGDFIFSGLNTFDTGLILLGTVPVTVLALVTDLLLGKLERAVKPKMTSENSKTKSMSKEEVAL